MSGRVAGLILAGGEGRRMGGVDKPLLPLGGRPLLRHVLDRLAPQVGPLVLSANGDPARYAAHDLPVLADEVPGQGPLAGLLRGLDWAAGQGCDSLLSVPGDTPFIPADLLVALSPAPAVAISAGVRHHLVAHWPCDCRTALRRFLATDARRSVFVFARLLGLREVEFGEPDPFFNINTPEELAVAASRLASVPSPPTPAPG
ncbi:molybdenum cofactor guanylyltransferase MobA [Lichenicoccus roseus]|uniref:Molybdenum cofactor guanylyltransferase n=1 Tax=Lichenicoccus roseus TaxID=2683649 RepID=A0A5R9JB67_9PROT|nr:molybdenum cofactor guanylyltransferase MobA [Lichenicoccus roseus]TLU71488.1 molybdenum cofactor guanylyltransferase [Lichenicoccus roseus]